MAKILVVADGFPSVLYPCIELTRRLAAAGYEMTFAGPSKARELVEHHGFDFLPLPPSRYEAFLEADARAGILERLTKLGARRERAQASMALDGFARALGDLAPDLVLIDGEMHEHILTAYGAGNRVALLNSFASIWRQPGHPPPHRLVRPGVGWKGSTLGTSLLWSELAWRKRWKAWSQRIRRVGCDRLSILQRLARDAGVDFAAETDDRQWLIPFTYRRVPVLSLHALELELPHNPPDRVRYVGPMLLASRIDRETPEEVRAALDALFERRRRSAGERKLIYAGFGSVFSSDVDFLKRLFGVVAERPDWELVVSLSDRLRPQDLGPFPERAHAFAWVPQLSVLRHADAVVTHGGIHTIDECVFHGAPMLVYCGFQTDMAGNTARVVHHGLGIAGDRHRDTTPVIREHLDRLLAEPAFEANLERMRRHYAAYVENRVAEHVVESLLSSKDA